MTVPVIDGRRLESLCAGEVLLAVELVDALIEDAQPLVTSIAQLADRRMNDELRNAAHSLKGIAGNIGAVRLQSAAAALEAAARDHDWDAVACGTGDIQLALAAVERLRATWSGDPRGPQACFSVET